MNDFFKLRIWFYLLLIIVGIALFRLPIIIAPVSAYLIPASLGVCFDFIQYNSNTSKAKGSSSIKKKLPSKGSVFSKITNFIFKIFVFCVICVITLWVIYELYNVYLFLEISIL